MDLSGSLGKEFNIAVPVYGSYGAAGKTPAVWDKCVQELVAKLDSVHFWAIVKLSLSPVIVRAGNELMDRLTDVAVDWAVRHAKADKKAKIQLYGPDNLMIREIDA